ncbi:MAG TPA: alkaline phosphatase family protein [Kofleriaceae bacterium]|nr:alkaline phosphatase family protein [Kofleriaceae bacterium]
MGASLAAAGLTFAGYSEGLPSVGAGDCTVGDYWRKHNPWVNFTNVPASANQPFTSFPSDLSTLPTVSFVIPNQQHDMHDGTIGQADQFLQQNIDRYVNFAQANNALLIVTWDEDDSSQSNQIPTIFVGPMVKPGRYSEGISHFSVLRTIEDIYGLPAIGQSAGATAITDVWNAGTATDAGVVTDASTPQPDASVPPSDASTGSNFQRTVVFMFTQTQPGQDMFLRGGIDFGFAASHLGRNCTASPFDCAIPIHHRNLRNATTAPLKVGDLFLDWGGAESGQSSSAVGSPMDWTTNVWPSSFGTVRTVAVDGFGVEPLNLWGLHYWMLDVDMDCSKTFDGWFELKSFVRNGAGWEPDVTQAGAPYPSHNHFGRCGQINRYEAGSGAADIHPFPN